MSAFDDNHGAGHGGAFGHQGHGHHGHHGHGDHGHGHHGHAHHGHDGPPPPYQVSLQYVQQEARRLAADLSSGKASWTSAQNIFANHCSTAGVKFSDGREIWDTFVHDSFESASNRNPKGGRSRAVKVSPHGRDAHAGAAAGAAAAGRHAALRPTDDSDSSEAYGD